MEFALIIGFPVLLWWKFDLSIYEVIKTASGLAILSFGFNIIFGYRNAKEIRNGK